MEDKVPLCVDLDGTLVRTDTLWESTTALVRRRPNQLPKVLYWTACGPARLKREVGARLTLDPERWPYDPAVLAQIQAARAIGRRTVLATAAHETIAEAVAKHLGCFDEVLATRGDDNLKSKVKAQRLVDLFGERGFDYVGNDAADLAVWARARRAYFANATAALGALARKQFGAELVGEEAQKQKGFWRRSLRVHQWAKNLLVLVPLLAAHEFSIPSLGIALGAAMAFSFCASSVYLLNDLFDLPFDRAHSTKRLRPLAAGEMSVKQAFTLVPFLLIFAAGLCLFLPAAFAVVLGVYLVVTIAYSINLKRRALVDVLCLATLYMTRVVAGTVAIDVSFSYWLLAFTVFLFFGLGMAKRVTEMRHTVLVTGRILQGRGYLAEDLPIISSLGAASSLISVLVLALYVNSPEVMALYDRPAWLWGVCACLLYWIGRIWLLANRGELDDDPVVFALRDRASRIVAGVIVIIALFAGPKPLP